MSTPSAQALPALLSADVFGNVRDQTEAHWDLRLDQPRTATIRVRFVDFAEARCITPGFTRVALHDEHPLLASYVEALVGVVVSRPPADPGGAVYELMQLVKEWSEGWRTLREYATSSDPLGLLSAGSGVVLNAPVSLAERSGELLRRHGADVSLEPRESAPRSLRALCVGPNFVVAGGFAFEERKAGERAPGRA